MFKFIVIALCLGLASAVPATTLTRAEWDAKVTESLTISKDTVHRRLVEGIEACNACENQMFDCSDQCDCAWGGSDIVQCMMCNSKCTAQKCAAYCARLGQTRRLRGKQLCMHIRFP